MKETEVVVVVTAREGKLGRKSCIATWDKDEKAAAVDVSF